MLRAYCTVSYEFYLELAPAPRSSSTLESPRKEVHALEEAGQKKRSPALEEAGQKGTSRLA